ncbi:Spata5, partial [Acrasis kona]
VVGITSNIEDFDDFIRRKFDEELFVDAPTHQERLQILTALFKPIITPHHNNEQFTSMMKTINSSCHGFVHADLLKLQQLTLNEQSFNKDNIITIDQIMVHVNNMKPYSMITNNQNVDDVIEIPNITFEDIGGLTNVKSKINEMIIWPLQFPESYHRMSIKPPGGLLLYGPPGTGKTLIAKAIATASDANFISINIPDLIKSEIGESEKSLAQVFRRAKLASPCVIFFDEMQAMFGNRDSVGINSGKLVSQLMLELDSLVDKSNNIRVVVIAATNVPGSIDPALMRPGRLENVLYVGVPDAAARCVIWKMTLKKMKVSDEVVYRLENNVITKKESNFVFDFGNSVGDVFTNKNNSFVDQSDGYTGADIVNLCHRAGLNALSENVEIDCVELRHFEKAFETFRPSVTKKMLRKYEKFCVP